MSFNARLRTTWKRSCSIVKTLAIIIPQATTRPRQNTGSFRMLVRRAHSRNLSFHVVDVFADAPHESGSTRVDLAQLASSMFRGSPERTSTERRQGHFAALSGSTPRLFLPWLALRALWACLALVALARGIRQKLRATESRTRAMCGLIKPNCSYAQNGRGIAQTAVILPVREEKPCRVHEDHRCRHAWPSHSHP